MLGVSPASSSPSVLVLLLPLRHVLRRASVQRHADPPRLHSGRVAPLGATFTGALIVDGLDHYAVGMKDPEGNEFDIN